MTIIFGHHAVPQQNPMHSAHRNLHATLAQLLLQLTRSPVGKALPNFHYLLFDVGACFPQTVMRLPAALCDALDALLQITLHPQPTRRTRNSELLAQSPKRLLFPYRCHHELHSLFSNIHRSERHPRVCSRARFARAGV
ncbi:MAG TPA: hypothetical protein VM912_16375 [Terriglobales bacterium]|nr:hypothetical protein [Terriglobales bacterium]